MKIYNYRDGQQIYNETSLFVVQENFRLSIINAINKNTKNANKSK